MKHHTASLQMQSFLTQQSVSQLACIISFSFMITLPKKMTKTDVRSPCVFLYVVTASQTLLTEMSRVMTKVGGENRQT